MAIVKLLDAKSADYQICAKRWVVQVEAAQDSEAEKAYMLRRLESGLAITPDGRACPAPVSYTHLTLPTILLV